jgi:hypothetical protein
VCVDNSLGAEAFALLTHVELLLDEEIDHEHLGKGMVYNELTLQKQPFRASIITAVTNMTHVVFIRTTRNSTDPTTFSHFQTIPLSLKADG